MNINRHDDSWRGILSRNRERLLEEMKCSLHSLVSSHTGAPAHWASLLPLLFASATTGKWRRLLNEGTVKEDQSLTTVPLGSSSHVLHICTPELNKMLLSPSVSSQMSTFLFDAAVCTFSRRAAIAHTDQWWEIVKLWLSTLRETLLIYSRDVSTWDLFTAEILTAERASLFLSRTHTYTSSLTLCCVNA